MSKLPGVIVAFFLVSAFISCQKQSELHPPSTDDTNQEHHGLWRIKMTNTNQPKEVGVWEFKYDNLARVTDFITYKVDSNTTGRPDTTYQEHFAYFYKGADTLPYKSTAPISVTGAGTTIYYIYDSQGRKILDSNESKNTTDVYYWDKVFYNYSSNKIVITEVNNNYMLGLRYYADTIYTSSNNNISKIVHRVERPGVYVEHIFYTYTYDDKKNPFYDLNIKDATFFNGQMLNYVYMYYGFNRNNQTEEAVFNDPAQAPSRKTTITHIYNTEGYPIKSVFVSTVAGNGINTYMYDYK